MYYAGGKLDRVTYATIIFGYAKKLELIYGEEELTKKLADHFEKGIRHAFNGLQVKSKNTLFQILTDYDNDGKRSQNRKTNRDQNKSEVKSDDRSDTIIKILIIILTLTIIHQESHGKRET